MIVENLRSKFPLEINLSIPVGRCRFFAYKCIEIRIKSKIQNLQVSIIIVCEIHIATPTSRFYFSFFLKSHKELAEANQNMRFFDFRTCSCYNPFLARLDSRVNE